MAVASLDVRIALGLGIHLGRFARDHDAQTWHEWARDDYGISTLLVVLGDSATEIVWNLTGVSVATGLLRAAAGQGGPTDQELFLFRTNPQWLDRTRWFRDGVEVGPPPEMVANAGQLEG